MKIKNSIFSSKYTKYGKNTKVSDQNSKAQDKDEWVQNGILGRDP